MYRLACQSILKQLKPIHHQGWCIALGAFRTSPAQSFYVEAHTLSLASSRLKLSLNYVLKLKSLPELVLKIPPLGIRILPHLEKSSINLNLTDIASSVDITPWMLSVPTVHLDLTKLKKDTTNAETYKQFYLQLISEYPLSIFFPTNSSKTEEGVAAAALCTKQSHKPFTCRLPNNSSIYTAVAGYSFGSQTYLLFQGTLKHICCSKGGSFLILSIPLSSLQSVFHLSCDHLILVQILELYMEVTRDGGRLFLSGFLAMLALKEWMPLLATSRLSPSHSQT